MGGLPRFVGVRLAQPPLLNEDGLGPVDEIPFRGRSGKRLQERFGQLQPNDNRFCVYCKDTRRNAGTSGIILRQRHIH
jgi:hypothetical protein